ncbi:MAG: uracil-DNA glycosylase [Bryobacteraceae bacterium]
MTALQLLQEEIVACERCPRLVKHRTDVARNKRRAYRDWNYWGKPVPSFGDPGARLLIVGLAPGAHGANRTGRMFTGDRSGDFLYKVMHETGFASQPTSIRADDGLTLIDAYISASVHCAPPDNKPSVEEIRACQSYLERELELLPNVRVVIALGKLAFDAYLGVLARTGRIARRSAFLFGHERQHDLGAGNPVLISSYHPSQQNTQTGKLTEEMFRSVFERAKRVMAAKAM